MADLAPDTAAAPPASPAPSPAPAAPATPSPAAAPAPAPKSIADETAAVFRAKRAAAAPAESSPAEPTGTAPAQAAIAPAAAGEAPPPVRGPIPYDRHEAVLTRARREAREEAEKEVRGKFAWAEKLSPEDQGTIQWLLKDPHSAIAYLQQRHAKAQPPAPPDTPAMPEPDITLGDGQQFYSAGQAQKLLEWRDEQLESRINGRYGPMLQEAALSKLQAQATTEATQYRQYYHANFPMFKELEADIKDLCLKNPQLSIEHAYTLVFRDKGLAKQREAWESERAGQLARKAAASSTPPGAAQPATPRPNSSKSTLQVTTEMWNRKRAAAG